MILRILRYLACAAAGAIATSAIAISAQAYHSDEKAHSAEWSEIDCAEHPVIYTGTTYKGGPQCRVRQVLAHGRYHDIYDSIRKDPDGRFLQVQAYVAPSLRFPIEETPQQMWDNAKRMNSDLPRYAGEVAYDTALKVVRFDLPPVDGKPIAHCATGSYVDRKWVRVRMLFCQIGQDAPLSDHQIRKIQQSIAVKYPLSSPKPRYR